jgi:hypothetical protein
MRIGGIVFGLLLGLAAAAAAADVRPPRTTRCCVDLGIVEAPGPVCAQVRGRRGLRARRACRLLGGTPIGQGECSLAACRPPA